MADVEDKVERILDAMGQQVRGAEELANAVADKHDCLKVNKAARHIVRQLQEMSPNNAMATVACVMWYVSRGVLPENPSMVVASLSLLSVSGVDMRLPTDGTIN